MKSVESVKILFVGNSHTYNCDIPYRVKLLAAAEGVDCQVAMNAHGGWTLYQHSREPDVPFNLLHGGQVGGVIDHYLGAVGLVDLVDDAGGGGNQI